MASADWGTDLDWGSDLEPNGLLVDGFKLLGQAAFHALVTPRGACLDSPDRGIDLREFLHQGLSQEDRAFVPNLIRQELLQDERILGVEVGFTETVTTDGLVWDFRIVITPDEEGPFELVFTVDQAAAKIVSITPAV